MARKNKSVYERISATQEKIASLEEELKLTKQKLESLNKEKDELEMRQMFEQAKVNNLSLDEVIKAMSVFTIKKSTDNKK